MYKKYIILFIALSFANGQTLPMGGSVTNSELDLLKDQLKTDTAIAVEEELTTGDLDVDDDIKEISITTTEDPFSRLDYFGYTYFLRDINFFDNVPTPINFKLGSGDKVVLSLWGERNIQETFTINREGSIYYEKVGFINLANKTLEEAEEILTSRLASTYATLKDKDNPTQLSLSLGKIKSINVYFTGHVSSPGIHLIHPFSDIFSSIVQAGGITENGSLRSVEIVRNGQVIHTIDFYNFLISGKGNFSNIRLLDGDVIHVPTILSRSEIMGSVYNPAFYELLPNETLGDLIRYSGGLTPNASSLINLDIIEPAETRISDDNAVSGKIVNIKDAPNFKLNNGTTVYVEFIQDVATRVRIMGQVKSPGYYPATNLKEVLDIAGGFNDPLYRPSIRDDEIIILRKDNTQFYGLEFKIPYSESAEFNLIPDDKIFVYEDANYNNTFTIRVEGEVNKAGTYAYSKNMTVLDAINLAEGFTDVANKEAFTVLKETAITSLDGFVETTTQETVQAATLDYEIDENSVIVIQRLQNVVIVSGNVYTPGLVTYNKGDSIKDYINKSGGVLNNTLMRDIYITRTNGEIVRVKNRLKRNLAKVKPGDIITIPLNPEPRELDVTRLTSDIVSILTNLATIIFIIDSNTD